MDTTIRIANVAVLLKLETTEGVDAAPSPTADALPVEADSASYNSPWTNEASNEATGSYVASAPLIIGQPVTFSFRSRIKGAGAGTVYTSSVKPPHHQAFQSCGWRGQFQAAIATALATAGTTSGATLANAFPAVDNQLIGQPVQVTAGSGAGRQSIVSRYSASRIALLSDTLSPALDATSSISLIANWTYAGTSPSDASARLTDHPSATVYIYEDGVLWKFVGARGSLALDGKTARPGYGTWTFNGIYAGKFDTAVPSNIVVARQQAPVLVQGAGVNPAMTYANRPLAISTWSLDAGTQMENPDDPNSPYGFAPPQIVDRTSMLKIDPLATQVATRDAIALIGAGDVSPAVIRHGTQQGNRWALTVPYGQLIDAAAGARGKLRSEELTIQCLSPGRDAVTRDIDRVITFY